VGGSAREQNIDDEAGGSAHAQNLGGSHEHQKALGVDATRPVPNKAELKPLAQTVASRKTLRTLGSGAQGSRRQGKPVYFL